MKNLIRALNLRTLTLAILFLTASQQLFAAIDLDFSHKRGYYNTSFQLVIETDNPNATIRYTTNKSKPSRNSGTTYNGPITVNKTTLLRVFAYTGTDESNVRTHSYIFVNDVINADYMYTYITKSAAYAPQMENSLKALPVISLVSNNINGNNHIDTEIETSVELFFPDNSREGFMLHSGIQTWGGSPTNPKRNYRLEFKSVYGTPKLEYDVFKPDNYDDTEYKIQPVNKFDKLLLRSGSQDALNAEHGNENVAQYVRNRYLFDLQMEMGYVTPHGRYVHVYVNGDYMGQYHLLERPDANFFEAYYGGEETDYEVYKSGEIWDGPYTLYNSVWENLPSQIDLSSQTNINNTNKHIDLDQAAAYLMLMSYASGFDWFENHNCLAGGNITPDNGGYKFLLWDVDFAIGNGGRWDPSFAGNLTYFTAPLNQDGPVPNSLNDNIEFRYMMADHMECTCYNDGILTADKVDEAYMHRINQVKTSLIAESARWGDYNFTYIQNGNNSHVQKNKWDVNEEFTTELNDMRNSYLPNRTNNMINNWVSNGITSDLKAVQFNQYGGLTNQGFRLLLSNNNQNSRIYYTLDGSDPRAVGGGISSTAILYNGSVTLPNGPVTVKARIRDNNHTNNNIKKWSAMCPRKFYTNQNYANLVINEIHYNPKDSIFFNPSINANDTISGRHFEFIEIKNTGNTAINLQDVAFNKGVTVNFGNNMIVGPNDFFIVAEDSIAFNAKYGFFPDAIYIGKLSNSSENLWLVDPLNNIIDSLRYMDVAPWDTKPDNGLYSLALTNVNLDNSDAANWSAQTVYTTPNAENLFCSTINSNPFLANVSCSGGNDGFVVVTPSGGNAPYTYNWSSGQTASSISNLNVGDYTVTIKDALQCELIETFTITQPNLLSISVLKTDQSYFQTNDGTATVNTSGGVSPYSYSWNNGASTASINNLASGNYTVTVTDINGCKATKSTTVNAVDCNNLSLTINKTDQAYFQKNDGTAVVNTSGGTSPYSYSWSNGASTAIINNLTPGNYTATVKDINGCKATKNTTIKAVDCSNLSLTINKTDQTYFQSDDGAATANVSGGNSPYRYIWNNGATTATINNLAPSIYAVDITDNKGCTISKTITIDAITCNLINVNIAGTNETYFEAADGTAIATIINGIPPYRYNWSNGATTQTINNLAPDNYTLNIIDKVGCQASSSTTIAALDCSSFSLTASSTNETYYQAADGTATANPQNGTAPYSYSWNTGASTASINSLAASNYTVIVTDDLGCTATTDVQILSVDCSSFTLSVSSTNETFYQAKDGTALASPNGGTMPYSYNWSNGLTSAAAINLVPANYTIEVIDNLGCPVTETVTIAPLNCSAFSFELNKTDETYFQTNNGMATASVTNGTSPYLYAWSNGSNTATVNNLSPGNYTVIAEDALGCSDVKNFIITAIDCTNFSTDVFATHQTYFETNDGTAGVNITGGTSPYIYNWSSGANTSNLNNLTPDDYAVTVTDINGCSATKNTTVNAVNCRNLSLTASSTNETYYQAADGTATANPQNGTAPYSYSWNTGASTASINSLAASNYTVTVTDDLGCPATTNVQVSSVDCSSFTLSVSSTNLTFYEANDGTALASPTGGTMPYSYNWSNGLTTAAASNLAPGNYTVNVIDNLGCPITKKITVAQLDCSNFSYELSITDETYFQTNNGIASVNVTNGTSPYSYTWSNGSNSAGVNNLSPGLYTVIAKDALGCSDVKNFSIAGINCSNFAAEVFATDQTYFETNDGTVGVNITGGTSPYVYNWSNDANTSNLNNLPPNNYTVTVTDVNGCSATKNTTVNAVDCSNLLLTITTTDETYFQTNNGTATANIVGGAAPYNYDWNNMATSSNINNLSPGNYTLNVTDNIGCPISESITINAINCDAITLNVIGTDETYFEAADGTATATINNGLVPYNYNWSNGATTQTISNLAPGNYSVDILDKVGCAASGNIIINAIDCSNFSLTASSTNETFYQAADGTATANPQNGTTPYSYSWNIGANTASINSLAAGNYAVTVTDDLGCTATADAQVLNVDCSTVALSVSATNETFYKINDGTALASPSGGTTPYSYNWSNGETTAFVNNLAPGNYIVEVADNLGCPAEATVSIAGIDCSAFDLAVNTSNETYFETNDGTAAVNVINGFSPYTYNWSDGSTTASISNLAPGNYTIIVEDVLGCSNSKSLIIEAIDCNSFEVNISASSETYFETNDGTATAKPLNGDAPYTFNWSNGGVLSTINNLTPSNYTVDVTDNLGCKATATTTVEAINCNGFSLNIEATDETYFQTNDGSAVANLSGGTTPFIYNWTNGETTASVNNLAPETYILNVLDNLGCAVSDTAIVQAIDCNTFSLDIAATNETYFETNDGTASANPANGINPYSYTWSNGDTSPIITDLAPNSYSVEVLDAVGCSLTDSISIKAVDCSSFSATVEATDETIFQANNGTATANPVDGTAPYTYNWSNGETTASVNNLAPDTYTINVTDAIGCVVSQVANIAAISCSNFSISTIAENETYFETNDGMAAVIPINGTTPYTYNWSNGDTTANVSNLAPSNYTITVQDAIACSRTETIVIDAIDCADFDLFITSTGETYYQSNDGLATVNLINGTAPLNYLWSNDSTTSTINNLAPDNYSLTVKDAIGCEQTGSINITGIDCTTFSISVNSTDETYFQANDGTAKVIAFGISPYTYNWSNGAITDSISGLPPGDYMITAIDSIGCSLTDSLVINPLVCDSMIVLVETEDETCFNKSDGSLYISDIQNGTAPYSIDWSNGNTTASNNNITQGNYTLNITDNLGCTYSNNYMVDGMSEIIVNTSITDASSEVVKDGAIDLTVTGGAAPYSYYWSTAATTEDVSNLLATSYWVYVTDSVGCSITKSGIQVGDSYMGACVVKLVQINAPRLRSGTEQVIDYISTNGYINAGNIVTYKAGSYINLQNGFEVKLGAAFEAAIEDCGE